MSVKDGKDYLYLIWKSEQSRKQYIVAQLTKNGQYEFCYCKEVYDAIDDGFSPLLCFPELDKVYKDNKLFPIFCFSNFICFLLFFYSISCIINLFSLP